jgi:hypothetical protein
MKTSKAQVGILYTSVSSSLTGSVPFGRSARMTERADENDRLSDGHRELVECCADPVAGGDVGGEFVVAAAEILDEGMPGGHVPLENRILALNWAFPVFRRLARIR